MAGIILSLFVTLVALSFAFHVDDTRTRTDWLDPVWNNLRRKPTKRPE